MSTLPAATPALPAAASAPSLPATLLDVLISPADAFDNVLAAPPRLKTWLGPILLAALASLVLLAMTASDRPTSGSTSSEAGEAPAALQSVTPAAGGRAMSELCACAGAFAGTFWSALMIWFIARVFLGTTISYRRSLEVVALTSVVAALGAIFTALLIGVCGDPTARPALSLLAQRLPESGRARQIMDTLNFFQIWTTAVLAIGLSRLSGVSFKEAAFWVFGYWLVARLALILLS